MTTIVEAPFVYWIIMQLISEWIKRAERVSLQTTNLTFENQTCFTCSVAYLLLKNREADHNFIVFSSDCCFECIPSTVSTFWNAKVIQTFFFNFCQRCASYRCKYATNLHFCYDLTVLLDQLLLYPKYSAQKQQRKRLNTRLKGDL